MKTTKILEVAMEIACPKEFLEKVALEFGQEKARECGMSTSVGGIGPLLRERIVDQSESDIDVIGVTLLYESVWVQAWHEWGQINLQKRAVGETFRKLLQPTDLDFSITFFDGQKTNVTVWALPYGKTLVYFLSAPEITNVVYPGAKDTPPTNSNSFAWAHECRLKQSWLVGRGALILSKKLNRQPDITVLSETPTIFGHHRLVRDELQSDEFFEKTKYIFNDHTPLEYAHPLWDGHTLGLTKLDSRLYLNTPAWNPQKEILDVTSFLVSSSEGVYGVAKKHGEVMKKMPSLRIYSEKIKYVTNGVRRADWQAPELRDHEQLSDERIIEIKNLRKKNLLDWAWRYCRLWPTWSAESQSKNVIVWTRRITPYKRLDILTKLLHNEAMRERFMKLNSILFIGGRIHQQDQHAQDIVYDLLEILENNPHLQKQIVPIHNFNILEAPLLFQGADASIMLADDTREASATGFMKAQMNGSAILATSDGAVPEFVQFGSNGFLIPYINGEPTAAGLLEALETFDQAMHDSKKRMSIVRAALAVTNQVDVHRTVVELQDLYQTVVNTPTPVAAEK